MGFRSKAERERIAARAKARARRIRRTVAIAVAVAALIAGAIFSMLTRPVEATVAESAAPLAAWDSRWEALPQPGRPTHSIEAIRAAYAFAANREDIVRYLPCYCGCEREGHRSLRDCFIEARAADGMPKWGPMGYT